MINPEKLKGLRTVDDLFDEKYGKEGTESRREFNAKAMAWYYAELLREERKKQHISQTQLANISLLSWVSAPLTSSCPSRRRRRVVLRGGRHSLRLC